MDRTIEAFSLADLTQLAANPPSNPNTPTPRNRAPLTLYIARVPGSRDVFLTPIKPRERVVTAYDVQNSLFYVHVNLDGAGSDGSHVHTLDSPPADEECFRGMPDLQRKPVPAALPPRRCSGARPTSHRISRKPVLSDVTNAISPRDPKPDLPVLPPRPPPPCPQDLQPTVGLEEDPIRSFDSSRYQALSRSNHGVPQYGSERATLGAGESTNRVGCLTLIRRDPGPLDQWNVALIHDPPEFEVSPSALRSPRGGQRKRRTGAPLLLDILNPTYSQFHHHERPNSRTSSSTTSSDPGPPPTGIFRRHLRTPASRSHPTHRSNNDTHNSPDSHTRGLSIDWRAQGYSFESPWHGTCEFSTGAAGTSLKCRHHLPGLPTSGAEVSELRFNLPVRRPLAATAPTARAVKRSSYFSRSDGRRPVFSSVDEATPTMVIDDETGRIDLSLGQERAGGGFGGRQAKLGKLIVWPEGLKMLDLLVAANVGLWWRAYEKEASS